MRSPSPQQKTMTFHAFYDTVRAVSGKQEKGGDDVKSSWPFWFGLPTCYIGRFHGKDSSTMERFLQNDLSSECPLQLEGMKLESPVIVSELIMSQVA